MGLSQAASAKVPGKGKFSGSRRASSLAAVSLAPTNNEVTKYCVKKKLALSTVCKAAEKRYQVFPIQQMRNSH